MILHYFKNKENKDKKIASLLYSETINASKLIIDNNFIIKKKEFNLSFEINSILLISILIGSKNKSHSDWYFIRKELLYIFIKDLDYSMRSIGIPDMSVGKYVKNYTKKFYFRISRLEEVFKVNDYNFFYEYLRNFNIINDNVDTFDIKLLYSHLNILIKRVKILKDKSVLYFNLFK